LQRTYRLRKNKQFQYVYRRGKSSACKDIVILHARGAGLLVGFSISKKIGNAVVRNLVKRRLRECFRSYLHLVKPGWYVVVARPGVAQTEYRDLEKGMAYLLKKQNLLREGNASK
jgi:ribonuclease P protein component